MVVPYGSGDLYHKYRPRKFGEVAGHNEVMKSIKKAVAAKHPSQAFLLIGESGTGKTSTARIMAMALNCTSFPDTGEPCGSCDICRSITEGSCPDIQEVNAADHRGIGDIRNLCKTMSFMPMHATNKIYILDEAHQLTKDAQHSLLKELEEAPKHVFIILCSTHPASILPTVKNRCQKFKFRSLSRKDMVSMLEEIATYEGEEFLPPIYNAISDASEGSPRKAVVYLQQIIQLSSKDMKAISKLLGAEEQENDEVFKICFALTNKRSKWVDIVSLYNDSKHIGAPGIGMMVAGYLRNQLLKTGLLSRAKQLELFKSPFPEGKLGENQLVLALHAAWRLSNE